MLNGLAVELESLQTTDKEGRVSIGPSLQSKEPSAKHRELFGELRGG